MVMLVWKAGASMAAGRARSFCHGREEARPQTLFIIELRRTDVLYGRRGSRRYNNTKFDLRWGLRITKELLDNLLFSKPPRCVVTPTQPPPGGGSFRIHTLSGSHGIQHATVRVLNIFVEKASRLQGHKVET